MATNRKEFTEKTKLEAFRLTGGRCKKCTRRVGAGYLKVNYDHIKANVFEPDNSLENCMVLCEPCHRPKTNKDLASLATVRKMERSTAGIEKPKKKSSWQSRPMNKAFERGGRQLDNELGGWKP
jgi:5-methylcytosine-specific restriction enzyme A